MNPWIHFKFTGDFFMIGPKYRRTIGGWLGWFIGTTLRYGVLFGTGYLTYEFISRRIKRTMINDIEKGLDLKDDDDT